MRRIYIYILALLALSVACQQIDLPEVNQPAELPTGAIGSKATITFSTADFTGAETRGIVNNKVEVVTLHLIVFDENGMLVEVCEARELDSSDHDDHTGGKHYTVTLTVTDEPRIIHYVANCPVNQVVYGHETSVIGNMFVDRNNSEGATTIYEVSYWARIEVPYIHVEEKEVEQDDGNKKIVVSLVDDIKDEFMHVPLLRNYAEITITDDVDNTDNTFEVIGFTVYNLLNRGTVAPYNSNTQEFQSFFEYINGEISKYSYPKIYKDFHYEGHALTSAKLITDLVRNPDGTIKEFKLGEPFYVYERKVSVMTDEEEKWRESPPHIIIKARYNGGQPVDQNSPIYYYKVDLVYTEKDANGNEEIKYYNILRNFQYDFNITKIHDVGYSSWEAAKAGAAGNNISGSSSTSKLTNVSDDEGRLWVSYTDITLVTGDAVSFKYKYIPNYYNSEAKDHLVVNNDAVYFENVEGEVITRIERKEGKENDIKGGEWDGYREVIIYVNEPSNITRQQVLSLRTDNANLNRQIRHTLRQKYEMEVECTPKVKGEIMQKMQVNIKLPAGLTEDMFPLYIDMETMNRTLSPDATENSKSDCEFLRSIPVTAGKSIIESRKDELSYYYTVTIPTLEDYKRLPSDGDMKVVKTHWYTNMAENASTFYVANKYFEQAYDSWENYTYEFSGASCSQPAVGVGQDVIINFSMDSEDDGYQRPVTITLVGMTHNGEKTVTYTPKSKNNNSLTCQTTTATDPVSFTLNAEDYNILGPVEGNRLTYKFDGQFVDVTSLEAEADVDVNFTFNIPPDAFEALKDLYPADANGAGVPMYVTLVRMHPADDEDQLVYSQVRTEGDRYIYRIKQAGTQTIRLATSEAVTGLCTVTLQADYFDTQSVEIPQSNISATAEFREWRDGQNTDINSSNTNYVIVGQAIRYYVNVSSSSEPTSVSIDGKKASRDASIDTPKGTTVWYIDWTGTKKENHSMSVQMVVDGTTFTNTVGTIKVASWSVDTTTATKTPSTDGKTMYVMQNTSYATTYCTSKNNNLSASKSLDYYSLFTFEASGKIKSVAKGTYCTGTTNNGSISFNATGTAYTFNNNGQIYTGSNYLRQSSDTEVKLGKSTTSNRSWQFYPVSVDIPE